MARPAVVDQLALANQLAVAIILLDAALDRARQQGIGEAFAGDGQSAFPGGGEQGVAAAQRIGADRALSGGEAGIDDEAGLGQRLAECGHAFAGPAVVAMSAGGEGPGRRGAGRDRGGG